jgi:hypothetical protein
VRLVAFVLRNWLAACGARYHGAQTFLRVLGIEITFSREGRVGNRIIRIHATTENTVSTVSSVFEPPPLPAGDVCKDNCRPDLVSG